MLGSKDLILKLPVSYFHSPRYVVCFTPGVAFNPPCACHVLRRRATASVLGWAAEDKVK